MIQKIERKYFNETCKKVAKELDLHPTEVKVIVRYFFKSLSIAMKRLLWVKVPKFFKLKMNYKLWKWSISKGLVEDRFTKPSSYKFANYKK